MTGGVDTNLSLCYGVLDGREMPPKTKENKMNENFSNTKNIAGWDFGDPVIVQIPVGTGFSTFDGTVADVHEDGQIEVYRKGREGTVLCRPEWVYSDDCWLQ